MSVHIALLRGINVGGHNKMPMASLVEMFEAAGCDHVRTYIQSGNVIFAAAPALAQRLPGIITASIGDRLDLEIPVIIRSSAQLTTIVRRNPYVRDGADESKLSVGFLAATPSTASLAELDPQRSPPDEFTVCGSEIFLRCPNGVARSKLTNAYFDATLGTTSTMRNWRTTLKLLGLATE